MSIPSNIPHTNPAYDREMEKMTHLLNKMENTLCSQLSEIEIAFTDMDPKQAHKIQENDLLLNKMEGKALKQAIAVLACYQPVAEDLRKVVSALYAATEYERIGDYVKNFAKSIESFILYKENLKIFPTLLSMVRDVRRQFESYLTAYNDEDINAALSVLHNDQEIDKTFRHIVNEAVRNHNAGDGNAHSLLQVIAIASNLERIGDRIKNLVEIFYYRKTGQQLESKVIE